MDSKILYSIWTLTHILRCMKSELTLGSSDLADMNVTNSHLGNPLTGKYHDY